MASNHLAVIDSFVLPAVVWRKIWFIGKKEYFRDDTFTHRLQKWFFTSVSVYPVDRDGGKAAADALNVGRKCLESGNLFGIYPEGTRSPDGKLYKGHTGVSRLALEKRVPVIPVAMIGTLGAQKPGQAIPKPLRIGTVFGPQITFPDLYDAYDKAILEDNLEELRKVLRIATDRIMHSLYEISEQDYVDIYASKAKDLLKEGVDIKQYALDNNIRYDEYK